MNEKDMQIIEVGMKLFARKGFSATSIQEIATESGISKGAFYLHFKSKDDLLMAIIRYHFEIIQLATTEETGNIHNPREKFIFEQQAVFQHFIKHRDLLVMLAKEQAIPRNDDIKKLLIEKQMEAHQNYRKTILDIYGIAIEPFSWDLTIILEGIINSYMGVVLFSYDDFDWFRLPGFILNRFDHIVKGMDQDEPFLTNQKAEALMARVLCPDAPTLPSVMKDLEEEIQRIGEEELVITLQVLKEEIGKDNPRVPVIQGMLSNFKDYTTLAPYQTFISEYYLK